MDTRKSISCFPLVESLWLFGDSWGGIVCDAGPGYPAATARRSQCGSTRPGRSERRGHDPRAGTRGVCHAGKLRAKRLA